MLIVGYCYDIRFERKLCEEVKLHLGYRWFCRLELDIRLNQRMSTHACSPPFQLADSWIEHCHGFRLPLRGSRAGGQDNRTPRTPDPDASRCGNLPL
jgi:hypothetical protein